MQDWPSNTELFACRCIHAGQMHGLFVILFPPCQSKFAACGFGYDPLNWPEEWLTKLGNTRIYDSMLSSGLQIGKTRRGTNRGTSLCHSLNASLRDLDMVKMMLQTAMAAAVASAIALSPAEAGVIYKWQEVTPDAEFGSFTGTIEFFDHVWQRGGVVDAGGDGFGDFITIDRVPIENMSGKFATESNSVYSELRSCGEPSLAGFCTEFGGSEDDVILSGIAYSLWAELGDELQHGGMWFNDTERSFSMIYSDVDGLWHFDHIGSDATIRNCDDAADCTGTGRWVLDASTVSVPEPATLALLPVLGLGAMLRARRRAPVPEVA